MAQRPTILVFDSGLGGLTVHREIARARADATLVYAADDAFFPYGAKEEPQLIARVTEVMDGLISVYQPDLVVVACNTASTIALPHLRERFAIPFVGTVPAIKPACATSKSRMVSVLGTPATVRREYTQALIRDFADGCDVTLVGAPRLAVMAEAELNGEPATDAEISQEIAPCFVTANGARTDTIVMACTHYPLLLNRLERLAPWSLSFIDPAPAIARRVVDLLGPASGAAAPPARFFFSSGRQPSARLRRALGGFGIGQAAAAEV